VNYIIDLKSTIDFSVFCLVHVQLSDLKVPTSNAFTHVCIYKYALTSIVSY
jgi:hypothetical protein